MDHTVYERKNTDLGSTSMTKSGGFSIKKRHRKLGALIGLAALAVPFAANLGTLGDAIHAVTGPQNVYESELLNVKLKTSQDKTKTTWDLEFHRSETSVSEQTVKFKLDLDKAGLKDAEIKQDDKTLDMREGIVSAVLKSQSTHLILTAISTNEDKHDITLPVTELGLYDEKNGENKLPVDNRSVDLTMAFEKVAEIAKESSSETVTEAVAKEEKKSEDKQGEKAHRVVPNADKGFIAMGGNSPIESLPATANIDDQVQLALIDQDDRTTPISGGTATDGKHFQIWSSDATNTTYHRDGENDNGTTAVNIYQKFNAPSADIGGSVTTYGPNQNYRNDYHNQYLTSGNANNDNQSAYNIEFSNDQKGVDAMKNTKFEVFYDNVGYYVDTYGDIHDMGAAVTITNVTPVNANHNKMGSVRYIDLPNNIYSGVMYHGIESLDMEIRFYAVNEQTREFTSLLDLTDSDSLFTFNSLNNFGTGDATTWNDTSANSPHWNVNETGIQNSIWAETVSPLDALGGDIDQSVWNLGQTVGPGGAVSGSAMEKDTTNLKWFSKTHGNYDWETTTTVAGNWADNIDDTNTFPMGSVAYTTSGVAQSFRMFTGTGNTWQTLTCANNKPMQLNAPRKLVTRDNIGSGDTQTAYQKANSELKAADTAAADIISETRKNFTTAWAETGAKFDTNFYVQRENEVGKALTTDKMESLGVGYGDLYNDNLALTSTTLINGNPYFTYDYWVMQPTYDTGTYSLVKPAELVISDTLDTDVTLEDVDLGTSATSSKSIVVYNTNGGTFNPNTDYDVSISTVNGKQQIVVTFTAAGLKAAIFDGGNIALDLDVKVSALVTDDDDAEHDFKNTADVETGLTKGNPITTNMVPVHITPKPEASLQITKMDNKGNKLQNAMFKLEKIGEPNSWDGSTWNGWTDMTLDPDEIDLSHIEGSSSFIWEKLTIGKYQLSEITTPGGYTGLTQNVVFYVSGVLGANKEQILQEIKTDDGDTYSADVIANWDFENDGEFTDNPSWVGPVINDQKLVNFELYKVDDDKNALDGAEFSYAEYDVKTHEIIESTLTEMKDNGNGYFTLYPDEDENPVYLDYNKVYAVDETKAPSGYAMPGYFYFRVVPQAQYDTYKNVPDTTYFDANRAVSFLQVDASGNPIKWLPVNGGTEDTPVFTGSFYVQNDAKSIFPRVGGTGIQAYIGAGVIIMLIAGGAAWYIKRRQNQ